MLSSGPLIVERMEASPYSKRKREEGRYAVDLGRSARGASLQHQHVQHEDCFQEAFAGQLPTTVRSSWLYDKHCWTHESVLHNTKRHYGAISLKEQIRATQQQLLQLKTRFGPAAEGCAQACNTLHGQVTTASREFHQARSMCNPYEELHLDHMFLNRAGIKLANIDAILDFTLTGTNDGDFTFVDLCGAPGGFSEYLMKRCHSLDSIHACRGWGMSLCGMNQDGHGAPWKLQHVLNTATGGTYTRYTICEGSDGTGDVYQWENIEALQQEVLAVCGNIEEPGKVHLVVADGGFDAQRNAECQEEVAHKIVVCQASAALSLLRKGGTFVLKMFGFQTSTTRNLLKSLFHVFTKVTVVKPISSRPASAERYLVFEGYKGTPLPWDGRKWQSAILLGNTSSAADNNNSELETNLMDCLDECDRDILKLNQKACFEILSYMERKTLGVSHGHYSNSWRLEKPVIDMEAYKHEWRL